jgi:cytochrome c oxidase subunit II
MRTHALLLGGLVLVAIGVAGLVALESGVVGRDAISDSPEARGEWIFRTGTSPDGRPIPHTGNRMMMMMSCAGCHGLDGHGLRTPMFISPDITYRNLTNPAGMQEPDGGRGPVFTDDQIKRAITQGLDPEGERLAWPMPRWRLTNEELDDLLAYLKVLPGTP